MHRILERLRDPSADSGDLSVNIDCSTRDSVLAGIRHVLILDLKREWDQRDVAGCFDVLRQHLEGHGVIVNLVCDDFLKLFELRRAV